MLKRLWFNSQYQKKKPNNNNNKKTSKPKNQKTQKDPGENLSLVAVIVIRGDCIMKIEPEPPERCM
jgi:hypothetical protein